MAFESEFLGRFGAVFTTILLNESGDQAGSFDGRKKLEVRILVAQSWSIVRK
jgi:hypothetical protein